MEALADRDITLEIRPLLDSTSFKTFYDRSAIPRSAAALARGLAARGVDVCRVKKYDAVLVQRDAALLGPPLFEWLCTMAQRKPLILDLDDATYLDVPGGSYRPLARLLKWPSKTDTLIRWAAVTICGNETVAAYVDLAGTGSVVMRTVVPTDTYCPRPPGNAQPDQVVLGWIGSHSAFPYLEAVFPALEMLSRMYSFKLRIVGSGRSSVSIPGVEVECVDWELGREPEDFQALDIGLYPLPDDRWAAGKSGLKAIEFMAVGVPFVASPVGAATTVGVEGITHLCAATPEAWVTNLGLLLADRNLRERIGSAGRVHALANFSVSQAADAMASAIRIAIGER